MYASVPITSPGLVSGSPLATCATPKSASFAKPAPAAGSATTITFWGFTSRWTTPRACACPSASQSTTPIRAASRSETAPALQQLRERAAAHQLGHEVDLVLVEGQLVDGDDARMVQPGGRARLALDPLPAPALERHRLDGHLALELLVPRQPDHAEPARAQAAVEPVAAQNGPGVGQPLGGRCVARAVNSPSIGHGALGTVHPCWFFGPGAARPAPRSYSGRTGSPCPSSTNRTSPQGAPAAARPVALRIGRP